MATCTPSVFSASIVQARAGASTPRQWSLLRKDQSEGTSYLEVAEFLHAHGAKDHIACDLEQLLRRMVFNVEIGNRDDHLRNHGFLLTPTGWRLAPAFDLNPNTDRAEHVCLATNSLCCHQRSVNAV